MLNFFRLTPENYTVEDQITCLPVADAACSSTPEYSLPMKPGDVIQFIADVADALGGLDTTVVKIGISSCGVLKYEDVGTIVQIDNQVYVSVMIPDFIVPGCYEFMFYGLYNPIDCSVLAGMTLGDLCDAEYRMSQWCGCPLSSFCE